MIKEFIEILTGFKRALKLIDKQEKRTLIIATCLMVITGILSNLPAVILGKFVDKIVAVKNFDFTLAAPFISTILVIILVREIITVIRKYLVENVATHAEKKQTVAVIDHLLRTDVSAFINEQQIGSLHGKIIRSIQGFVRIIKLGFLDFFPVVFSAIAAICIAFSQKPLLASIMILVIPVGLFIVVLQISSQKGIRVALLRGKEKIDGTVVEMLGGIESIRTLNTVHNEVKKIDAISESLRIKEIKHHISMALFDSAKYLTEGFFYILVISISVVLSAQGVITKGDILVYSILFMSITNPLREIHRILDEAHESSIKVNDLYSLMNQPLDISFVEKNNNYQLTGLEDENYIINTRDLSFNYPANPEAHILDGINLSIKKGEKIGIVGASGCGKSTFVKILLRLLHNYSGEIYVLGMNLKNLTRHEIAEKIAYVPQNPYVFSGTVEENILYGCSNKLIAKDEIIKAAREAQIYDEIMNTQGGFTGRITENGKNLSGGQKQRLVIARLILQSPDLLIFDEATASLDNKNEEKIQQNIERIFKNKTIITIAHRLTTLKNSDRILVFDKGHITQQGTYDELAKNKGLFQDFLRQEK